MRQTYTTQLLIATTTEDKTVCEFYFMPRKWRFFSSVPEARRIIAQLLKQEKIEPSDQWRIETIRTTSYSQYFKGDHSFIQMGGAAFKKHSPMNVQSQKR